MDATASADGPAIPYPLAVAVVVPTEGRNRLTVALRPILAAPHWLLVGPAWVTRFGSAGLLGSAAYLLAVVNWFAMVAFGEDLKGVRDFQLYYLRWRTRAIAYESLLVDAYPPFGDAPYPAAITVSEPLVPRDRVSIAVRLLLAVPHLVVLFFLTIAWCLVTIAAWVVIVFTGHYPAGFETFALGCMRWLLRVEAYLLLLVDDYPPFTLD